MTKKSFEEQRKRAYKESPETTAMTDFLLQHENKLYELYGRYIDDIGGVGCVSFTLFVMEIFRNGQELVIDPKNN